jgi:hypothetical protein
LNFKTIFTVKRNIWALIMQHPRWMAISCFGAAAFGAVFPGLLSFYLILFQLFYGI